MLGMMKSTVRGLWNVEVVLVGHRSESQFWGLPAIMFQLARSSKTCEYSCIQIHVYKIIQIIPFVFIPPFFKWHEIATNNSPTCERFCRGMEPQSRPLQCLQGLQAQGNQPWQSSEKVSRSARKPFKTEQYSIIKLLFWETAHDWYSTYIYIHLSGFARCLSEITSLYFEAPLHCSIPLRLEALFFTLLRPPFLSFHAAKTPCKSYWPNDSLHRQSSLEQSRQSESALWWRRRSQIKRLKATAEKLSGARPSDGSEFKERGNSRLMKKV